MGILKRENRDLHMPNSPPPEYIETFDTIPLTETLFDRPTLTKVEKEIKSYRNSNRNKVAI